MFVKVVSYHNGGTDTFHFVCFRVYNTLGKVKTFCPDFSYGSLYGNVVGAINLCKEVGFYVDNDNPVFLPVDVWTYGSEIFSFTQIVKEK